MSHGVEAESSRNAAAYGPSITIMHAGRSIYAHILGSLSTSAVIRFSVSSDDTDRLSYANMCVGEQFRTELFFWVIL